MDLSVVVPVHNEVDNVGPLYHELDAALRSLGLSHEIIFVDDGSRDGSFERLAALAQQDPRVVVVRLSRNYGQTAALAAGLAQSTGRMIPPTSPPSWPSAARASIW